VEEATIIVTPVSADSLRKALGYRFNEQITRRIFEKTRIKFKKKPYHQDGGMVF